MGMTRAAAIQAEIKATLADVEHVLPDARGVMRRRLEVIAACLKAHLRGFSAVTRKVRR